MFKRTRIKWAFRMGKYEHKAGRLLGLYLFISSIISYFLIGKITFHLLTIGFLIWLVYILSHTFEKRLFGSHGPRSGWK